MGKRKALQASAPLYKLVHLQTPAPLQSTGRASPGAPVPSYTRFAVHAGSSEPQGRDGPFPDSCSPCSKAEGRPSIPSRALFSICSRRASNKTHLHEPASPENKVFLTLPQSYRARRAPAPGLPPAKPSRGPSACQLPVPAAEGPPLSFRPRRGGRGFVGSAQPIPVQQVCSPVPHCYCSHATPRRHTGTSGNDYHQLQ